MSPAGWAADLCSTRSIVTQANVTATDGPGFRTESYFRSRDAAAIRHIDDSNQIIAVEGPYGWMSRGNEAALGPEFYKIFALGHQYHALLLYFEDILDDPETNAEIAVSGSSRTGKTGTYPYGGVVHLVDGEDEAKPHALVFELPETPPIVTTFYDWRSVGEESLPFHVKIDDGTNVFDYHYIDVDLSQKSPEWFAGVTGSPSIDEVQLYRLYRKFVTAHCAGNKGQIAELVSPEVLFVAEGKLRRLPVRELQQQFDLELEQARYAELIEVSSPVIEIDSARDSAQVWATAIAPETGGASKANESPELAWVLTMGKTDGEWKINGIVTSRSDQRREGRGQ